MQPLPRQIAADIAVRIAGRRRQQAITRGDPLRFDPCIDPRGPTLGYFHLYTPEGLERTKAWLESPVYRVEAARQHPIDRCHLAIDQFHVFLNGDRGADDPARAAFLATTEQLFASGLRQTLAGRRCFVLPHVDQLEGYRDHHKPWMASMVQGWAASLFLRVFQLTGDERYLDAARLTCGPFFVPVEQGGLRSRLPCGLPFYEKYPFPGQVRHVLNGFMSSLFGLYDLVRATDDACARELFEEGFATMDNERTLRRFDNGYCTLYDLGSGRRATPSGVFYTWVHARQLAGLARLHDSARLVQWSQRWRAYVFDRRYTARASIDCWRFRARNLPLYLRRYLPTTAG